MAEARIDLHAHTSHSEDRERVSLPNDASVTVPFHPVLSPCRAYDLALERGLTHVTFTDHDTLSGGLELLSRHPCPERFIMGVELTCFHRGSPLHVGIYGLTEEDFERLQEGAERTDRERRCLRWNVPALLEFLADRGLPADLKHPVWRRAGQPVDPLALRELLQLFPVVESINGTRHRRLNDLGRDLARALRGGDVAFTGGSDSHSDNIGRCYTICEGETTTEVLAALRAGRCRPVGSPGSHRLLDYDIRTILRDNVSARAGHLTALAGEALDSLPTFAAELASLAIGGAIAYTVVQEFARQRELAREVEALFAAELERGATHAEAVGATPADRAVH